MLAAAYRSSAHRPVAVHVDVVAGQRDYGLIIGPLGILCATCIRVADALRMS